MATSRGVTVQGAAQLRRTLRRAGSDLADLKEAHAAAGAIVVAAGRTSGPRRSGRLVGSMRASKAAASATIRAGGASVPYANPIHWGWGRRNIGSQPWVSLAAQATEPTWSAAYAAAVDKIIARIQGA